MLMLSLLVTPADAGTQRLVFLLVIPAKAGIQ